MSAVLLIQGKIDLLKELVSACNDDAFKESYNDRIVALKELLITVAVNEAEKPSFDPALVNKSQPDDYFDQYSKAQLNANLLAQLPSFSGNNPGEVNTFVTRCKQLQRATEIQESTLVRIVKGKFGANAFRTLEQFEESNKPVETLEELYAFMRTNWSLHLSVFQLLESVYLIDKKPEDSWPKYNSILQSAFAKVKFAHVEFVRTSLQVDKPTTDHVFDLLQSHVLMNRLHQSNEDLYRVITCEQSSLKTPTLLSQRAQTLETQGLYKNSSVMFNQSGQNRNGQGNGKTKKKKGKGKVPQLEEAKPKGKKSSQDHKSKGTPTQSGRRDESRDNRSRFPLSLLSSTHWALSDDEQSKNC